MQLHEQQIEPRVKQAQVGGVAEPFERWHVPPQRQNPHHDGQGGNLTEFHAHVEAQDAPQHGQRVVAQRQLLQPRGQAKPVQQTKAKHGPEQVGRCHLKVLLEAPVVVECLVHHAQRNDGVDQVVVPGDLEVSRQDQRDAVADGEHGDELRHILERGEEKHHAKQEQQVVVAGQHVAGTQPDVVDVARLQHANAVGLGDAVGQRDDGEHADQNGKQPQSMARKVKKFHGFKKTNGLRSQRRHEHHAQGQSLPGLAK